MFLHFSSGRGPFGTDDVQCFCRKACFSGVYYSAVKMCSRQKLGILSLISEVIGGFFFFNLFSFYRQCWKGKQKGQEFTVGNRGFCPHGFFSLVRSVLFLISSNQIFGGKVIKAIIPDIHSFFLQQIFPECLLCARHYSRLWRSEGGQKYPS